MQTPARVGGECPWQLANAIARSRRLLRVSLCHHDAVKADAWEAVRIYFMLMRFMAGLITGAVRYGFGWPPKKVNRLKVY